MGAGRHSLVFGLTGWCMGSGSGLLPGCSGVAPWLWAGGKCDSGSMNSLGLN